MLWLKKKAAPSLPQPNLPQVWSSEFWEALFGEGDRFHCLILVRAMKKRQDWKYESRKLNNNTEYYGMLGRDANPLAEHISVTINFDVSGGSTGSPRVRENCIGWLCTQEWRAEYNAPIYLSVTIRSTQESANEFESVFHRAKSNGQDFVPLWLWGEGHIRVNSDGGSFGIIQPLDRVSFQQLVNLAGKVEQDK